MRGSIITIAATAVGLAAVTTFAAPVNTTQTKTPDAATTAAPAPVPATDETTTTTTTTTILTPSAPPAGAGTSKASLPGVIAEVKPRRLKGDFINFNQIAAADANRQRGGVETENLIGVKYALTDTQTIGLRQLFLYNYQKSGADAKAAMGDTYLRYVNSKLATFGEGSLTGDFRLYAPLGEKSRFVTGTHGYAFAWLIASYPVGKFSLNYHVYGSIYNQSQNWYRSTGEATDDPALLSLEGKITPNKDYAITQAPEVVYNFSDKLSASLWAGTANTWFRSTPVLGTTRSHVMELIASMTYKPITEISITARVENDVNIFDASEPFRLYRDNETAYQLQLAVSI